METQDPRGTADLYVLEGAVVQKECTPERSSVKVAGDGGEDASVGMWLLDDDKARVHADSSFPIAVLQVHVGATCETGRAVEPLLRQTHTPDQGHLAKMEC